MNQYQVDVGLIEFVMTPLVLLFILVIAYYIRPFVTDRTTKRYFIPAILVKCLGSISLGLIYQYYYGGGDTFNYYSMGSTHIWDAFNDSPMMAIRLIFLDGGEYSPVTFQYASRIYFYGDSPAYFVVRVAGLFGIMTLNSYYSISLLFAALSFTGVWALYYSFYRLLKKQHLAIAISVLFVPSVFFWGSGLLKDTLTLGALGWLMFTFIEFFIQGRHRVLYIILMIIAIYVIYTIKIYILLNILPALIFFTITRSLSKIKHKLIKIIIAPIVIGIAIVSGFYAVQVVGKESKLYSIEELTKTAQTSAEWLYYVSNIQQGSGYTLGNNDYSTSGIIQKFSPAVWVSFYRPYLWEAHNIVMVMSAIESTLLLVLSFLVIIRVGLGRCIRLILTSPLIVSLLLFSISFAFAIGLSTYNFGSLVRYKIPLIPMFLFALILLWERASQSNSKSLGHTI